MERIRSRGYTPSLRETDALFTLLASTDKALAEEAEDALVRIGPPVSAVALARFESAVAPLRGRLLRLATRVGGPASGLQGFLLAGLLDPDPKTRRNAATALGKRPGPGVEEALLAALEAETRVDHQRTLVTALGKVGTERSVEVLKGLPSEDPELSRLLRKAILMLERTQGRVVPSRIDATRKSMEPMRVLFRCRAGIESILAEELGTAFSPKIVGPGRVSAVLRGTMASVYRARTFLSFGFELPTERVDSNETLPDVIVRALTGEAARSIFRRFTEGPVRYRLAFDDGAHHRAVVWECADRVAAANPDLVNDPTQSVWEVVVTERKGLVDFELRPRALQDARFTYRVGDVPAASHPTLAAALARVAGMEPEDIVWDPFVGSGSELIERAKLGPCKALLGSDMDPKALAVAEQNAKAAGVTMLLEQADARTFAPRNVTLVLTNPPMGRRVVHHTELGALLQSFIEHLGRTLKKGARVVWLSPHGDRTAKWARENGFRVDYAQSVDMGGFTAQLQRLVHEGALRGALRKPEDAQGPRASLPKGQPSPRPQGKASAQRSSAGRPPAGAVPGGRPSAPRNKSRGPR